VDRSLEQLEQFCSNCDMHSILSAVSDGPESTRDQVLRSAMSVLAANSGASLAEIAAAAGVGRTTVHRIFPTRGDLLRALALHAVAQVQTALDSARLDHGPVPDVLGRVAELVLPLTDELRFLDAGPEVWDLPELRDAWCSIAASLDALVERGQREGDLRGDLPAELIVEAFTGMLWGVWQGIRDGRVAPATAARHVIALALAGIAQGANDVRPGAAR
jgi:AcrR family transcriptional regulator